MKRLLILILGLFFISNAYAIEIKKDATPVIYVVLVDSTDGFTPETGITSPTVYYVKQGGSATNLASPTWAELDSTNMKGLYSLTLTASMTDTTGNLIVYVTKTGCRDFRASIDIVANIESDTYGSVTGGVIVTTNNDKTGYKLSATGIDAIWNEIQTGHTTASSFGKYLDAQVSLVGGGTAADIADAVWDELLSGHTGAGSTGVKLGNLPDSGTTDWTTNEKTEIKAILGVTNTGTPDSTPDDGVLKRIQRDTSLIPSIR